MPQISVSYIKDCVTDLLPDVVREPVSHECGSDSMRGGQDDAERCCYGRADREQCVRREYSPHNVRCTLGRRAGAPRGQGRGESDAAACQREPAGPRQPPLRRHAPRATTPPR